MIAPAPLSAENGSRSAIDPARLQAANINPKTGLATDYLNHFNEAIMLLDLLPNTPECIVELIGWEPLSYQEHFAASHFKDKDLAIAAYEAAEPAARGRLDELADTMNALLVATWRRGRGRRNAARSRCARDRRGDRHHDRTGRARRAA